MVFRKKKQKTRTVYKTKTKNRYRTRVVTKIRRVGSKIKRKAKSKKSLWRTAKTVIVAGSAVSLLSQNQVNALPTNAPISLKLKAMANAVTGSILSQNFFADAPQAHFHPKLEGAFNQWTTTYGAMWIFGAVAQKFGLKRAGKIKQLGMEGTPIAAIAGIMGFGNNNPSDGKPDAYSMIRNTNQSTSFIISSTSSTSGGSVL